MFDGSTGGTILSNLRVSGFEIREFQRLQRHVDHITWIKLERHVFSISKNPRRDIILIYKIICRNIVQTISVLKLLGS